MESSINEDELNVFIMKHIQNVFSGHYINKYDNTFKSIKHYKTGKKMTEFDGLFLLKPKLPTSKYILVFIESKHHVTLDRVVKKIAQYKLLIDMIDIAKRHDYSDTHVSFRKTIQATNLDKVDSVFLYIGGLKWQNEAKLEIEKYNNEYTNNDNFNSISTISPSGTRYTIKDKLAIVNGGRHKK